MFDCIVVGAGPAGASTAYHLARLGRSVLLLDKAPCPRDKPCSGALSPIVADWFDFDFTPAIAQTVRHIRYTWKLGDEVMGELPTEQPLWIVQRQGFDAFLVQQAIAVGAAVQDTTPVLGITFQADHWQVQTPQGMLRGRYVVAADGAMGPMANWLGLQQGTVRSAAVLTLPMSSQGDRPPALNFEFGLLKQGCLWAFPQGDRLAIGAATFLGKATALERSLLADYARGLGFNPDAGLFQQHPIRLWNGFHPLHTRQAVVVGEAAALTDPLSAEGIRHGLYSGITAASAIHHALEGDENALRGYTEAMHSWGKNIQWAQRIASVFFRVPGVGYRVGIKRPTMTTRMGQLLMGDIQYSDIATRVIKRLSGSFLPGQRS